MIIMHIDCNSAFLSWSAVDALKHGSDIDYRTIPAIIGGDESARQGIVLAKSNLAKKFGIVTGESLMEARRKCPGLTIIPPNFKLYMQCSNAMFAILSEYSPKIERYSIDECFLDYTGSEKRFGDPVKVAYEIKDRIKNELGFTVNIGVSVNKALAKMGSELEKPDRVHTLFPEEIEEKMWPLPVGDLFMVGRASRQKLESVNIKTIGDLARSDLSFIRSLLKSHGDLIWEYANGIDNSEVVLNDTVIQKGVGNSLTIDHDVHTKEEASKYLLILCEKVGERLRKMQAKASVVSIGIRTADFFNYGHQLKLSEETNVTSEIYENILSLFEECWHGEAIRLLSVYTSDLNYTAEEQISMFGTAKRAENEKTDKIVDEIRNKFGKDSITRGSLISKNVKFRDER